MKGFTVLNYCQVPLLTSRLQYRILNGAQEGGEDVEGWWCRDLLTESINQNKGDEKCEDGTVENTHTVEVHITTCEPCCVLNTMNGKKSLPLPHAWSQLDCQKQSMSKKNLKKILLLYKDFVFDFSPFFPKSTYSNTASSAETKTNPVLCCSHNLR